MTIGSQHESTVIVRVVNLAHTRSAIVGATRRQSRLIKGAHMGTAWRLERDVHRALRFLALEQPKGRIAIDTESSGGAEFLDDGNSKWCQRLLVKRATRSNLWNAQGQVIKNVHTAQFSCPTIPNQRCCAPSPQVQMSTSKKPGFGTLAVHAGWEPEEKTGAVMPPIYMTSTYVQDAPGQPREGFEYSRTQNITRFALQDALATLEGGACGFTFTSGMAAITTLLLTLKPGDRIVAGDDLYGGTYRLFTKVAERFGLRFDFVDTSDPKTFENLPEDTTLLYLETPSNPLLKLVPLELAIAAGHRVGADVCVDNTFATPALQQPLALGADFIIHSTTKYIAGHSDVVGGALIAREESRKEDLWFHQNSAGTVNSPFDAFLTLRGLRTLALRMDRHCQNALQVAKALEAHPKVTKVIYPGLPSHPQHELAGKQMSAGGGMVCFEIDGGADEAATVVQSLKLFALAESLGGVESLVELPAPMTHASIPAETRAAIGITDGLVRLSVGIEDGDDLVDDLDQALALI